MYTKNPRDLGYYPLHLERLPFVVGHGRLLLLLRQIRNDNAAEQVQIVRIHFGLVCLRIAVLLLELIHRQLHVAIAQHHVVGIVARVQRFDLFLFHRRRVIQWIWLYKI